METNYFRTAALAILLCLVSNNGVDACTTFCLRADGRIIFGKNYDWNVEDGMLIVNKRGVQRKADRHPSTNPARWTAKFGSVTFNQYGRNFPSGGMNEAGLVIELMWASGSRYPQPDHRPSVGCLEWIQYQLDTARNVNDVIASDTKIRIQSEVPLHFLIADREGNAAVIEFIKGKLVAPSDKKLTVAALANDLYSDALSYMERTNWIPTDGGSRARFIRAAAHVKNFKSGNPVEYAFKGLADVQSAITQWSIVYEIDREQLHFRTRSNNKIRTLSLKNLDFSCATPVLTFDLKSNAGGDIAKSLEPYSREENFRLIRSSFGQTEFLARTPEVELKRIADLPQHSECSKELHHN